ncbi:NAD(P)-binding protein, partial [Streptomyces sp. NEAU-H3]|nr:NAD(P)-binding protein [Streptomyces sp. NEAU-H3]
MAGVPAARPAAAAQAPATDWESRERTPGTPPRVLVIGAGLAGLAAGSYGRMSGLRTLVLEKHVLPGGCCTAW